MSASTPFPTQFKDQFSRQAADYAKFRPEYPDELFEFLANIAPEKRVVWDCATGNGQAARSLAKHFERVEATDASAEQIANARPQPGIRFSVATAENSGLKEHSVDLVTAATAVHWFDLDRFYREVKRVLKPGGVLALWGYNSWEKTGVPPEVLSVFSRYQREIVHKYFAPELRRLWNDYKDLPFPFAELQAPEFSLHRDWGMDEVLGFLLTWSATQNFIQKTGEDPLVLIRQDLAKAWESVPSGKIHLEWRLHMRVGRPT